MATGAFNRFPLEFSFWLHHHIFIIEEFNILQERNLQRDIRKHSGIAQHLFLLSLRIFLMESLWDYQSYWDLSYYASYIVSIFWVENLFFFSRDDPGWSTQMFTIRFTRYFCSSPDLYVGKCTGCKPLLPSKTSWNKFPKLFIIGPNCSDCMVTREPTKGVFGEQKGMGIWNLRFQVPLLSVWWAF